MDEIAFTETLAERLRAPKDAGLTLYWLGQAGFLIDLPQHRILIDPYLSNSLAAKYRHTDHSHERIMAAPITVDELGPVDLALCTHHHTDHMDGETLATLGKRLPNLRFGVPAAARDLALQRTGVSADRLILLDAGHVLSPLPEVGLHVFRAAHEKLEQDAQGHHRFLGYGLDYCGVRIFHSGDCIPFAGQVEEITGFAAELALLPVNGRSPALKAAGFAGNFTVAEAKLLARQCHVENLIGHHYGMFAFNTASPAEIDAAGITRARLQVAYHLPVPLVAPLASAQAVAIEYGP